MGGLIRGGGIGWRRVRPERGARRDRLEAKAAFPRGRVTGDRQPGRRSAEGRVEGGVCVEVVYSGVK